VTVLSTHTDQKGGQLGTFRTLEVSALSLEREMYAVWDRRRALPIPARLFLDLFEPRRRPRDRS
jgi:hypothetical protein